MPRYVLTGEHPAVSALAGALRAAGNEVVTMAEYSDEAARKVGEIDGLIICDRPVVRADLQKPEDYEKIIESADRDIMSAFSACHYFGTHMAARGNGAIVFLSSIHADRPNGAAPGYSIGEGAKQMMMRELALHLGSLGVRVNSIKLAPTEAELADFDSETLSINYDVPSKTPLHRCVRAEDAVGLLLFLLSPGAAAVNGADIRVDGGQTLHYYDREYKVEVAQ